MREYPIIVSDVDIYRLRGLLGAGCDELHAELEQAIVMPAGEVPHGVITMGSKVQVRNFANGRVEGFQLVYPREADPAAHRISVLAPLGVALLGSCEGDTVEWRTPGGLRSIRIERVMQEPRAATAIHPPASRAASLA
ncbi:MAG TPA: GreA/GreB family elongation factor [Steroidobacteraceae bacterium]|jgi:regulator of nucleoside diphosphate kinase|nr:GreA/GreB family elongation factor [Steroidobacteraceae bacterium]